MAKKATTKKPFRAAVDQNVLEARETDRRIRAHARLEREIAKGAKRLEKLIAQREESLLRLARDIVARDGEYELIVKLPAESRE